MQKSAIHIGFKLMNPETKKLEFVGTYCYTKIWPGMRVSKNPKESTCNKCKKAHAPKRNKVYE